MRIQILILGFKGLKISHNNRRCCQKCRDAREQRLIKIPQEALTIELEIMIHSQK